MTNPLRTKSATAKVTESEHQQLESAAKARGLAVGEWCREALLASLNSGFTPSNSTSFGEIAATDMVILTELLGVRMLLLNLFFPVGRGESLTTEKVQNIVNRADAEKLSAAIQCLEESAKRRN